MEPLAVAVQEALDSSSLTQSDAARITGLSRQHIQQITSRRTCYARPPQTSTLRALATIPGLSLDLIADAIARSMGLPVAPTGNESSALRRSAHAAVDQLPEPELRRALHILTALLPTEPPGGEP